jgi:hypothetical protein
MFATRQAAAECRREFWIEIRRQAQAASSFCRKLRRK